MVLTTLLVEDGDFFMLTTISFTCLILIEFLNILTQVSFCSFHLVA